MIPTDMAARSYRPTNASPDESTATHSDTERHVTASSRVLELSDVIFQDAPGLPT
jgi:hypothetical protein